MNSGVRAKNDDKSFSLITTNIFVRGLNDIDWYQGGAKHNYLSYVYNSTYENKRFYVLATGKQNYS